MYDRTTHSLNRKSFEEFRLFVPVGTMDEVYEKDHTYLFFLVQRPKDENLAATYTVEPKTIFYKPFEGNPSIFATGEPSFHAPRAKGFIELPSSNYSLLADRVETLCSALNAGSKESILINLRNLADSTNDEVVKENALFAIKSLE